MGTVLFTTMMIFTCIMIFLAALFPTIGAVDLKESASYNSLTMSYSYLIIAATLLWGSFLTILIGLLVAIFGGGFTSEQISSQMLAETNPTAYDLAQVTRVREAYRRSQGTETTLIFLFVIVALVILSTGIILTISTLQLGNQSNLDSKGTSAYWTSLASLILTFLTLATLIIGIYAYFDLRRKTSQQVTSLDKFLQNFGIMVK